MADTYYPPVTMVVETRGGPVTVNVYKPILTDEERAKRLENLRPAATRLALAAEATGRYKLRCLEEEEPE